MYNIKFNIDIKNILPSYYHSAITKIKIDDLIKIFTVVKYGMVLINLGEAYTSHVKLKILIQFIWLRGIGQYQFGSLQKFSDLQNPFYEFSGLSVLYTVYV